MIQRKKDTRKESEFILPLLTERQTACLSFISRFFGLHRYYPTHKEIAQEMGYHPSTAGQMVVVLEKKGYLKRKADERRNIRLTTAGRIKLEMIKKEEETKQE